jgi:hypothetical protein
MTPDTNPVLYPAGGSIHLEIESPEERPIQIATVSEERGFVDLYVLTSCGRIYRRRELDDGTQTWYEVMGPWAFEWNRSTKETAVMPFDVELIPATPAEKGNGGK